MTKKYGHDISCPSTPPPDARIVAVSLERRQAAALLSDLSQQNMPPKVMGAVDGETIRLYLWSESEAERVLLLLRCRRIRADARVIAAWIIPFELEGTIIAYGRALYALAAAGGGTDV